MHSQEHRQVTGRRLSGAKRDVLSAARRLSPGAATTQRELGLAARVSPASVSRCLVALIAAGLIEREFVVDGGRIRGMRLRLTPIAPVPDDLAGDELDELLHEIRLDAGHPRHLDAIAAYLCRYGQTRGYVGLPPPLTIAEWEAWPPEAPAPEGTV